jgi:hypothetical protein
MDTIKSEKVKRKNFRFIQNLVRYNSLGKVPERLSRVLKKVAEMGAKAWQTYRRN